MSIIYDALKKSQHARTTKARVEAAPSTNNKRKHIIITLLILTCLFAIVAALTLTGGTSLNLPLLSKKAPPVKVQTAALPVTPAPRLMLEGVFLSDTEKLAMINHHPYHVGDHVNGMQVINIAFDQVTLANQNRSVTLRTALTQFD